MSDSTSTTSTNDAGSSNFFLAGAIAGLMADFIFHPLDTLRARIQTAKSTGPTSQGLISMARHVGIRSLYQGFGAVAIGTVPGHALYFAGYEYSKRLLHPTSIDSNTASTTSSYASFGTHLCAGMMADMCGAVIWTPMEVIKQRVQIDKTGLRTSLSEAYIVIQERGIFRGLYRGYGMALATYGPYVSLYFALYEEWKYAMRDSGWLSSFIGAGLAGGVSAVVTCPLDVVKTRMQVDSRGKPLMVHLRELLKETRQHSDGWRRLFAGAKPRAIWMGGGTAFTLTFYEMILKNS